MPQVKLRKPFDRFPHPYIYAVLIDAIDVIGFLPVIGEIIDVMQTIIALAIFENVSIAIIGGAADFLLAGLPDVIPTFTLRVFLAERGII